MGGSLAPRSPKKGANTAIWLATDAPHNINGKFLPDRKVISFVNCRYSFLTSKSIHLLRLEKPHLQRRIK